MAEWVSIKWRDLITVLGGAAWDAVCALERRVRSEMSRPGPRDN